MNTQLQELMEASRALQAAMATRDPDAIWEAVGRQEKAADACLKAHAARPETETRPDRVDPEIHALAAGIRRIQQTNRRVASGFLEVIDRTLASLGAGARRRPVTYGADGWSRPPSAPVLVHQMG